MLFDTEPVKEKNRKMMNALKKVDTTYNPTRLLDRILVIIVLSETAEPRNFQEARNHPIPEDRGKRREL